MRFLLGFLLALCLLSAVFADSVHHLTTETFSPFLAEHDMSLIEFYAPWCGHCKALKPHYEEAAKQLAGIVPLAAVDCTTERELCNQHGVQGFPTLKIFTKGSETPAEYKGGRQTADIVSYMKKQKEPAVRIINAAADLEAAKQSVDDVLIVGYLSSDADKTLFTQLANQFRNDYTFALVSDESVASSVGGVVPSVVLHKVKSAPDVPVTHSGDLTKEAITAFIKAESFPLFGEIGPENFQKYVDRGLPLVWFFLNYEDALTAPLTQIAEQVAKDFKGKLSLVKLDGVRWAEHGKHFGVDASKLPGIVAEDREEGQNFVMNQNEQVSAESLRAHLQGFIDKTLKATIKSQPIPTQSGPVFTLVGNNFVDEVINNDKDVLVEFYAPWCGHCKSLAPKYEKLAEKFVGNDKVRIAAMDATENDPTGVKIKGFPTLYFYPAGKKDQPIQYNGDRTEEAMEAFIKENGSNFKGEHSHDHSHHGHSHDEL